MIKVEKYASISNDLSKDCPLAMATMEFSVLLVMFEVIFAVDIMVDPISVVILFIIVDCIDDFIVVGMDDCIVDCPMAVVMFPGAMVV